MGDLTLDADVLERWAEARREAKGAPLAEDVLSALGWTEDQARVVAAALKKTAPKPPEKIKPPRPDSPFAALAGVRPAPVQASPETPARRRRPRRKPAAKHTAP